ncbi:hypothetical protein KUCAC02_032725 [Chaenocephalus aceratus]|nr:hypothetical protein KUCAC02_032725 [Chaenocephalus aceratus]
MFMRGRPITMFFHQTSPGASLTSWYGYRGRDCRANVFLLPTGEMVYFVASVVVLFNYDERTQRHYLGHTDCVKCLAIHPDKIRIATGQIAGVDKTDGRCSLTSGSGTPSVFLRCRSSGWERSSGASDLWLSLKL